MSSETNTRTSSHRRASRLLFASVVVAVVVVVGFVAVAVGIASQSSAKLHNASASQLVTYSPGQQHAAPRRALPRLGGGGQVVFGGATGKPLVVNFFASWCPACRSELAAIASVARAGQVSFVGIDTDDPAPSEALSLLRRAGATYPVAIGQASIAESYGTGNLPTTAFLNGDGKIVALALGALTRAHLEHFVRQLVAGKPLS